MHRPDPRIVERTTFVPRDPGRGSADRRIRDADIRGSGTSSLRTSISRALPRPAVMRDGAREETPIGVRVFSSQGPLAMFIGFPPGAAARQMPYGAGGTAL